jgi:hypothetical protein
MSDLTQLSVADVRKALSALRKAWERHEPFDAINPSSEVLPGISMSQFCVKLVMEHHAKRHSKTVRHRTERGATGSG